MNELTSLALRTLIPGFVGAAAPPWAVELLERGLGGYCLFAYNIVDAEQVASLTAQLRQADPDALIAVDEESGDVTRLHAAAGSPFPGNAALGAADDPALTAAVHQMIGAELATAGVSVNFAPAVDVNVEDDNPVIGTRSFGKDPHAVARHAAAAVTGLQQAGVAACAKHFPGHGATVADSHRELPTVDLSVEKLRRRELVPFEAAVNAGAQAVMTGHIRVPALTGDDPATLSQRALTDLLRRDLGFDGAVVTDAVEMTGVSGKIGIPETVVRALIAGCDLVCTGGETQKTGPMTVLVDQTARAVTEAVRSGRLPLARLEDAAKRGEKLRSWRRERRDAAAALGLDAARRAVRVDGELPDIGAALIVQIDSPPNIAVGESKWGVTPLLAERLPKAQVRHVQPSDPVEPLRRSADGQPIVVVARDAHRNPQARRLVESLAAAGPLVLVDMGWPSSWRPAGAVACVQTHGGASANSRAAAEVLLGRREGE